MKSITPLIWASSIFVVLSVILALISTDILSSTAHVDWLFALIPLNIGFGFMVLSGIQSAFNYTINAYKDRANHEYELLKKERLDLEATRILLSKHIEHKLKARERIVEVLTSERSKPNIQHIKSKSPIDHISV